MRAMAKPMTADDLLPLVEGLTPPERARLLRLITARAAGKEAAAYQAAPPGKDEFSSDENPLEWEGRGWEDVR